MKLSGRPPMERGETIPLFFVDSKGCWIWSWGTSDTGYATNQKHDEDRGVAIHRLHYEAFNGPIPNGMEIDHLCRVRRCVNPAHLEAVTSLENCRRGMKGILLTHCPKGHLYDATNTSTWVPRGRFWRRGCKKCKSIYDAGYHNK